VYGGGGITPDIIVKPDTLTTPEQKLLQTLAPKQQIFASVLQDYASEMKGKLPVNFTVTPAMRTTFLGRLQAKGVTIDSALLASGGSELDRIIGMRITTLAFGDSTVKRKFLDDDNQLERAIAVLKAVPNQKALFAIAQHERGATASR
jgi:carboxyl-terminal processing protease